MKSALNRTLGAATAAYGAAILLCPQLLARPAGLPTTPNGAATPETAPLIQMVGARDTAIGLAMLCANGGRERRWVTWCRIGFDIGDALVLGTRLPTRAHRAKAAAFALAWAALNAYSLSEKARTEDPA
ncbi:DUF4267 domain-containing protein [Yinghuangia sp. YIM S09857]|uniref:DUF4267 domain-containing protein n=1 Tax=Yinghuangia sp. YIM S09857 TaxID=3436929 RepID=UPI003F534A21